MSDYNSNGSGRPNGRRGGRRHRSGSNRPNSNHSSSSSDTRGNFRPNRSKPPEPTGFQKFLSVVTFGLLGKPKAPAKPAPQPKAPRELGPIARSDREAAKTTRPESAPKPARPPRQTPISSEVTTERLYVGNLSYDASESDLFELFNGSGRVKNAEVVVNNRTQRSKGFAFVTMMSVDEAKKAVEDLNGKDFMGRPLVVGGAKPMSPRDDEEPRRESSEAPAESEASSEEPGPTLAA
ncbi:RNA-binding protein [Verrucomicrobium sp. BvORR106]|uniref:RNA recognition motif domain-containing protein n=1 Tax=Verrucomicrobium sp. BvORR106 TaxID=1403819 RepID=UPI0009E0989B|nr:RNA-binding protein [Verrucomicrobium sp. BvORR106]